MLKLEDIRFPITFHSPLLGPVTFKDEDHGVIESHGAVASATLADCVKWHNEDFPRKGTYSCEMTPAPTPMTTKPKENYLVVVGGEVLATPPKTFTEALNFAEEYSIKHNRPVQVVADVATIIPKVSTTIEVVYA